MFSASCWCPTPYHGIPRISGRCLTLGSRMSGTLRHLSASRRICISDGGVLARVLAEAGTLMFPLARASSCCEHTLACPSRGHMAVESNRTY